MSPRTPRETAGIDPHFLVKYGRDAIEYSGPYMAKQDGRWAVFEAWRVVRGENMGAMQFEFHWMRWWHPADLVVFVKDRWRVHREFGSAWRG